MLPQSPPTRVLIVDDRRDVTSALEVFVNAQPDMECLGKLMAADQLIETVKSLGPDVVLLDIDMPGRDAFDALAELSAMGDTPRTVMVSALVQPTLVDRAYQAGAWGYVSKHDLPAEIVRAVREALAGRFALSPQVEHVMMRGNLTRADRPAPQARPQSAARVAG